MKKLNKKGFTLIELLAVIAILAIMVVIAVPGVLNMYTESRIKGFRSQAEAVFKAAQSQFVGDALNEAASGKTYCSGEGGTALSLSSGKADYYIVLDSDGNVTKYHIFSNGYYLQLDPIQLDPETETYVTSTLIENEKLSTGKTPTVTCTGETAGLTVSNTVSNE